jgi:hypothetical protein
MSRYSLLLMVILLLLLLPMQRFWQWAQEYVSWQSYKLANGLLLALNSAVRPWSL